MYVFHFLSILIIVILSSQSDNSKICAISNSGCDACFISVDCVCFFVFMFLFLLFSCLVIFVLKPEMVHWLKVTEVNRLLVGCFIFNWLGIRLYLLFAVAVVLVVVISYPPCYLWCILKSSNSVASEDFSFLSCNPLFLQRALVWWW